MSNLVDIIHKGDIDTMIYILSKNNWSISSNNFALSLALESGNLEMVKWIYINKITNIDIDKIKNRSFRYICNIPSTNYIDVIKWLYYDIGGIDIYYLNNYPFNWSCLSNNLIIAKFLYEISVKENKPFDIHIHGDVLFKRSKELNLIEVYDWLCNIDKN